MSRVNSNYLFRIYARHTLSEFSRMRPMVSSPEPSGRLIFIRKACDMTKAALITALASLCLSLIAGNVAHADTPALKGTPNLKGTACYTNWWFKGKASDAWQSVINCPDPIGSVSVEQLYAKGWRVVSVSHMNERGSFNAVIIETQGR